jgi:hypothetical protein
MKGHKLALFLLLTAPIGCATGSLAFVTYTKIGLDVSATDSQPTAALFGYKRFEGAIVPVDGGEEEAMSIYAAIDLENHWLCGLDVVQVFATGQAAENSAKRSDVFDKVMREKKEERQQQAGLCLRNLGQNQAPDSGAAQNEDAEDSQ